MKATRMKYDLVRPCDNCPFRTDIEPYLHPARVREIQHGLNRGEFPCHKTTGDGANRTPDSKQSHCAGALIIKEMEPGRPGSQMMRIVERLGLYDAGKLDMTAPVYKSFEAMYRATLKVWNMRRASKIPKPKRRRSP